MDIDHHWHSQEASEVTQELKTNAKTGLSTQEAQQRLADYGSNKLKETETNPWYKVLSHQFFDVLIWILFIAAGISIAVGKIDDALTILAIVVLNGVLGFVQEWKAEKAIAALQNMLSPKCKVIRNNSAQEISAEELVPGDIVLLEIGDRVPADLRLIEALNLKTDESALTGESVSVQKSTNPVNMEAELAARSSIAWMGTAVTNGTGKGVVVATGMATEFGRIAELTQTVSREATPLQKKLGKLGTQLGIAAIIISMLVGIAGFIMGKSLLEMFFTGISLAVAVVPEGLPVVVTITMALGIRIMVKKRALLRRLRAAETLGAASIVCTDKTGTLTQNQMTVTQIWLPKNTINVTGIGYDPAGHFEIDQQKIDPKEHEDLLALLKTAAICNHAQLYKDEKGWHQIGEPTEAALITAAYKAWLSTDIQASVISEFSFNSSRKRMSVILEETDGKIAYVKGAPEIILERCTHIQEGDTIRELNVYDREIIHSTYLSMAMTGLRTLAFAKRKLPNNINMLEEEVEAKLSFLGIVGIIDPPRPEAISALEIARQAGISIIMITGDAAPTALAIAKRINMKAERAVIGSEIDSMNDDELLATLNEGAVFARTSPEHKLRIVELLQQQGHVVGMTGDGVNDAPALKKADIGISMGLRGTDVAKAASDMILTDDNFASIISAIKEGRRQYANIQKFIRYLLSSNMGEVVAIFFNILLGGPLILLPVQILWMNLITDGVTAMALGVEPAEKNLMNYPPRSPKEPILNKRGILMIFTLGSYIGLMTILLFHYYLNSSNPSKVIVAQTVAFSGIIILEKMNVFNFRSLTQPLLKIGLLSNPWIIVSWASMIGLQICAVYVPFLQHMLHTAPLALSDWGIIALCAMPIFVVGEIYKYTLGVKS